MLCIDCQTHVFPAAYAELLTHNRGDLRVVRTAAGYDVSFGNLQRYLLRPADYDPSAKLAEMDAAGVDVSVLSVNIPGPELVSPDLALAGARLCNDYLAGLCATHRGRFVGLASLPLNDVPAAIAELERAVLELDLRGVFFPSNIGGRPVDDPSLEPLYARMQALDVPLVLHPTVPAWGAAIREYSMIPMLGFMVDTSIAMLRLILSGVLERHPHLKVVHPHAGGVLPYIMGRVEEQTEVKRRGREHISRPPSDYYRRVYLDIVSPSVQAMRYAYDFAGADHLLFGSDAPWVSVATMHGLLASLNIPADDRAKIMGLNAARLFKLGGGE